MEWIWALGMLFIVALCYWPRVFFDMFMMVFYVPVGLIIYVFRSAWHFALGLERYLE